MLGGIPNWITPYDLGHASEMFVTRESDQHNAAGQLTVDPSARSEALMIGEVSSAVRGVLRFDMMSSDRTMYGTFTVYTTMDSDSVWF
jgi:hypothetical protein